MLKIALLLLTFLSLYFVSCKKESNSPDSKESTLTSDKDKIELSNNVGSKDSFAVQFSSNWILSLDPTTATWLKTNVVSGTGNTKVYVSVVDKNTSTSARTAAVVARSQSNAAKSVTISVTQDFEKQWQPLAAFPGLGRAAAAGFALGDKLYVGLGRGLNGNREEDFGDFYEYDATSSTWTKKGDFPSGPREYAKGFSLNGKGYIAMGQNEACSSAGCTDTVFKDVWEYDAANDSWKKVATFDNVNDQVAANSQVFVLEGKAYFGINQQLWVFDPATYSLTQKVSFPVSTDGMTFFSLNGKGYAVAGYAGEPPTYTKSVYEYDPSTDKWNEKGDFPGQGRTAAFGFSVNGKGYIACGAYESQIPQSTSYEFKFLKDVWEYNASADTWSQVADFPKNLNIPVIGIIGNKAIIGTGYPNPRTNVEMPKDFWSY